MAALPFIRVRVAALPLIRVRVAAVPLIRVRVAAITLRAVALPLSRCSVDVVLGVDNEVHASPVSSEGTLGSRSRSEGDMVLSSPVSSFVIT